MQNFLKETELIKKERAISVSRIQSKISESLAQEKKFYHYLLFDDLGLEFVLILGTNKSYKAPKLALHLTVSGQIKVHTFLESNMQDNLKHREASNRKKVWEEALSFDKNPKCMSEDELYKDVASLLFFEIDTSLPSG